MRPCKWTSSNKMGPQHTDGIWSPATEPDETLGRRLPLPPGMSCCQLHHREQNNKGEGKRGGGRVEWGRGCQMSNGIMPMRMPIYFESNYFQYLKSKGNFQKLSSSYTWTFVEEIMLNLQIPCGAYSALIPGVGIRAPCAERGEDRPLQCRSLSVKETQNQALKL